MRSGAAEVAAKAKTFLAKRAIYGTTEEARLKSVRVFWWVHRVVDLARRDGGCIV